MVTILRRSELITNAINTASTNADTAQASANLAITNAATAQSTANTASTNADTAITDAAAAQSTADTAVTNAATAQSGVDALNAKPLPTAIGTAELSSGEVVVSTSAVTPNSAIFLTPQSGSATNTGELYISARTPGVNFTITSTDTADTRIVAWTIIEAV